MKPRNAPLAVVLVALAGPGALAQPAESLAPYFGFDESRIIKVDDNCGPAAIADFNNDGRPDVAVVNNRKSRVEIYYLRASARPAEEMERVFKANELRPNPWYDRELVSVAHRVMAVLPFDVDGDGKRDLIYAGADPAELVVMRQEGPASFTMLARTRVKDLAARQDGLAVGDVLGGAEPELLAIAGGKISVFPMQKSGHLGEPTLLGSGDQIRSLHVDDFSGDGRMDVLGIVPDNSAPLRLWVQSQDPRVAPRAGAAEKAGLLATELRFEMPALREGAPLRFPGRKAASVAVIERASQRLVFSDLASEPITTGAEGVTEREVQAAVSGFPDTGSKNRSVAAADLNGDGMADLVTTDQKANTVVVFSQRKDLGLSAATPYSAFKTPKQIEVGQWEGGGRPEVFVLSEEEKAVGVSTVAEDGRLEFPRPVAFKTAGAAPVLMAVIPSKDRPALAVVMKDRRDYVLEVHTRRSAGAEQETGWNAAVGTIPLKDVRRDPAAILPYDFDRDGSTDLLILTPGEPMMMVRTAMKDGAISPESVLTKESIPQFGLVQGAGPENTALLDVDGDGKDELLIADANFVRACAYDASAGWRVVDQVNVPDSSTQLVGLALLSGSGAGFPPANGRDARPTESTRIVAADKANGRLLILARNEAGRWVLRERVRLLGFPVGPIRAGSFAGDNRPSILCLSDDAFAVVRLGGERPSLEQFAAWRTDSENRLQHTLASGDLNGDGYSDMVVLDAREQMCQILTFTASRKVMPATEFKVFESRLFTRGESRELEPSQAVITDCTGDGKDDLLMVVHDRVMVYPQMTAAGQPAAETSRKE